MLPHACEVTQPSLKIGWSLVGDMKDPFVKNTGFPGTLVSDMISSLIINWLELLSKWGSCCSWRLLNTACPFWALILTLYSQVHLGAQGSCDVEKAEGGQFFDEAWSRWPLAWVLPSTWVGMGLTAAGCSPQCTLDFTGGSSSPNVRESRFCKLWPL